jgi:hypothetical protein
MHRYLDGDYYRTSNIFPGEGQLILDAVTAVK